MSAVKQRGLFCKDQAFVAVSGPSRSSFQSGDEEFLAPLGASNEPAGLSNSWSSSASFQIPKYTRDDLQRILKTVLEAQPLTARGKDQKIFEDPLKWALKPKAPDGYKSKSYINCYNFIQKCKDYFAMFESQNCNQVSFAIMFSKERSLNRWQQYKWKIEAATLVPPIWVKFKVFL